MKKQWLPLWFFLLFSVLIVVLMYLVQVEFSKRRAGALLTVSYLDVGQGDATLIESPNRTQVLIDGGRDGKILTSLPMAMGYFDRTIDVLVATHPDMDHIGGLVEVLDRYAVKTVVMTDNVSDTPVFDAFMTRVKSEGATVLIARRGQVFDLGRGAAGSTTITILFPDRSVEQMESNASSIVLRLSYGDADFLFTGDSPRAIETYLVGLDSASLESEVLKMGHHGSRTSSDPAFVTTVRPKYGIISAGKDNEYGHPHAEVLETLASQESIIKNTAGEGSIFLNSDGRSIWFK